MGHPFEQRSQAEVPATPDEVWAAIASGPGIDSRFMGHSEVRPGANGTVRTAFGEYAPELDVTAWDPARRFAYRSGEAPDGRFIAYEFLIEGRAGSSTVLRTVTSGFLPGDADARRLPAPAQPAGGQRAQDRRGQDVHAVRGHAGDLHRGDAAHAGLAEAQGGGAHPSLRHHDPPRPSAGNTLHARGVGRGQDPDAGGGRRQEPGLDDQRNARSGRRPARCPVPDPARPEPHGQAAGHRPRADRILPR